MDLSLMMFSPLRIVGRLFPPVYKRSLARYVSSLCDNGSKILDVGCDDGTMARRVMDFNSSLSVVGVDVQANRPSKIERVVYHGKKLPFPDNSFDIVMALDVLHHVEDNEALLREMKRVANKYIIIKDHLYHSTFSKVIISVVDYCLNLPYGIKCAFNYLSMNEWMALFDRLDLKVIEMPKRLSFGFGLSEKYNPIFKLSILNGRSE